MAATFETHISAQDCLESVVPNYALLFFDHLYSEYLALRPGIQNEELIHSLDAIHDKRQRCKLTWSDIYTFDLTLVSIRPTENLLRKAFDARSKYRTIAGQKEYDEYIASNPPNLIEIEIDPDAQPAKPAEVIKNKLRADLEYLLSKFYLYYAVLPLREHLRDDLTRRAVRRTLIFVGVLLFFIFLNVFTAFFFDLGDSAAGLTVLTVALAGIMGGCVSMLQRIQSAPTEGDALFNLAALNNGWRGLSLSPLYGGIFASLLFILFAAKILTGSVFPVIHTPTVLSAAAAPTPAATPSPSASPTASPSPAATASPSPAATVSPRPSPPTGTASPSATVSPRPSQSVSPSGSPSVSPVASPSMSPAATSAEPTPSGGSVLRIKNFLKETGPVDGVSYALLIIWSFVAGFAERLVPDTLNRLVAKNEAIQGR
ncbi:MAG TPA: hypothetical protein VGW76_17825 [Pyrinomonadaceae bacterium]|nr:hypothetical protein [Pyrinomonadaceae bacterium]